MPKTEQPILDSKKTAADWDALPDVVILHIDICTALVCAKNGASKEEIERVINREHSTGISSRWSVDEEVEPKSCKDGRPDATHYALSC